MNTEYVTQFTIPKHQSSDNKISWAVLCEVGHMVERWGPGPGQCSCGYMPASMPTQFKTAGATIQTCTPSLWTRCCCLSGGSAYSSAPVNEKQQCKEIKGSGQQCSKSFNLVHRSKCISTKFAQGPICTSATSIQVSSSCVDLSVPEI